MHDPIILKTSANLFFRFPQYTAQIAMGAPFFPAPSNLNLGSLRKQIQSQEGKTNSFQCEVFGATGIKAITSEPACAEL